MYNEFCQLLNYVIADRIKGDSLRNDIGSCLGLEIYKLALKNSLSNISFIVPVGSAL